MAVAIALFVGFSLGFVAAAVLGASRATSREALIRRYKATIEQLNRQQWR